MPLLEGPAAPSPHPTTPIKVHFGQESGLWLPLAPPGGSVHFAPRELSDPGGGGGSRAWPPLPPRGGLAVPPNRTCGSPQADIFFAEAASAPRSARLRIPPRREEPRLNPFVPGPLPPPAPRKWGQPGGGGEEPAGTGRGGRAAGGQSPRWGEAGRSRPGGEGRETRAGTPRSRAGRPAEDATSGPPGAGRRAPWRLLQLVPLLPRAPKRSGGDAPAGPSGSSALATQPEDAEPWRLPLRSEPRWTLEPALGGAGRFQPWEAAPRRAQKMHAWGRDTRPPRSALAAGAVGQICC